MTHLSRDRLLDAAEGRRVADIDLHLQACARCRVEVDQLAATLSRVRDVDVPEPSPLFWEHLSARVHEAVALEPRETQRAAQRWRGVRKAAPASLACVLAIVVLVAVVFDSRARRHRDAGLPFHAQSAIDADLPAQSFELTAGDGWELVVDAASAEPGADLWDVVGVGAGEEPGAVDLAIAELSPDEYRELVKLLNEALATPTRSARPKGDA